MEEAKKAKGGNTAEEAKAGEREQRRRIEKEGGMERRRRGHKRQEGGQGEFQQIRGKRGWMKCQASCEREGWVGW
jgi:hypothetical protein